MAGFSAGKNLQNNINVDEAQTLSNKTLDSSNLIDGSPIENSTITGASIESPERVQLKQYDDLASAQADISNRNGGELIYVNDIKKTFQVNDDGLGTKTLAEISGGQGGVNYIENSDFEQGVDGYTDDTNFTISQTELVAEVLRGTASAKLSKAAVDASNEEISVPFTVSRADLAKKLTISFEYDASDPNYADNDILIGVRQDPNGTPSIIRINGEDLKGGKGTHYAQFQTDASQTEYELFFKVNSANSSAYDVIIDDVKVGPREVAIGPVMTDWKDFTPTTIVLPSNFTITQAKWRRDGSDMLIDVRGDFSGASTTTYFAFRTPDNISIEDGSRYAIGSSELYDVSTNQSYKLASDARTDGTGGYIEVWLDQNNPVPPTRASGDKLSSLVRVRVEGWSSNAKMSEDLGGREVVVEATNITGGTNSTAFAYNLLEYQTSNKDTTSSYSSGVFTAPEKGTYVIEGSCRVDLSVSTDGAVIQYGLYKNGSDFRVSHGRQLNGTSNVYYPNGEFIVNLEKGDTIQPYIRKSGSATITYSSPTESRYNYLNITKLASPQTILETETVAARKQDASGQSASDAVNTVVTFDTEKYDTHNSLGSDGIFTAPTSGYYSVKALITWADSVWSVGHVTYLAMEVNPNGAGFGLDAYLCRKEIQSTVNQRFSLEGSVDVYLNKGDQVRLLMFQNKGTSLSLYTGSSGAYNHLSIHRIK